MLSHEIIDGEPTITHIKMPKMKLAEHPYIAICVPVGDKEDQTLFTCHKEHGGCGKQWLQSGIRHPLLVPVRHMTNRDNLATPLNTVSVTLVQAGMYSAPARQIMTKAAIGLGVTYILYLDDDTIVPRDGLDKLHSFLQRHPQVGAVGGVCMSRKDPTEPIIFREHGTGCWWDCPVGPGAVPQPVWSPGAGMLLVRAAAVVDVIERMKVANDGVEVPIWADEDVDEEHDGKVVTHMWGHDVRFSRLLNEHEWPVYVHGEVLCGHLDVATDTIYNVPEDMPGMTGPRDVPRPECEEFAAWEAACDEDMSKMDEEIDTSLPSVDVIMVRYNQPKLEDRTIRAILAHTEYQNYSLIVHQNTKDVSLTKCWNKLVDESKADYVCLINSDTVPAKGWLTKLMETALDEPNSGAIVPSSNHVHMSQIETTLGRFESDFAQINAFAADLPKTEQELNMASGMCILFPRKVWEDVGKFDEDFLHYGSDTEFTWRLANKFNKKLIWRKDAYVHHYGQQSLIPAAEQDGWSYAEERGRAAKLFKEKTGCVG